MIRIEIENLNDKKMSCTCECKIEGRQNAIDEFNAVICALDKADHKTFMLALLEYIDEHIELQESEGEDDKK